MPDNTAQSPNSKKSRLGRGLGSLLGSAVDIVEEKPSKNSAAPTLPSQTTAVVNPVPLASQITQASQTSQATQDSQTNQTVQKGQSSQKAIHDEKTIKKVEAEVAAVAVVPAPTINEERQIWMLPIDRLSPNSQQPRKEFDPAALRDLASSIKEKGIVMPIVARRINERQFEIIAGERRWRAAQAAGLHEVPVVLRKSNPQDSLEIAIIENIQRENLNPIEEAEAFSHLLSDYSLTQQQIADKMGKERSSIANSLRLLMLPKDIRDFVRRNEISTGHAKVLLSIENSQSQISIAKQIIADKLSVRATEKLVAKAKEESRKPDTSIDESAVVVRSINGLSTELQKLIGTKVTIDYADAKGKLSIHFYGDDQLNHVVEKLRKAWEK